MTGRRQHSYLALDGMRGVAAIAVLFYHFPVTGVPSLFRNGVLAVDIFFLLSGFVIASAYDARLAAGLGTRAFMLARYIRLWPVMALGVAVGLLQSLVAPIAGKDLPLDPAARIVCAGFGLAILPCPVPLMFPTNPSEWSLFYELLANLLFALAFVPLRQSRRLIGLIGVAGAALVLGILHFHGIFKATFHAIPLQLARVGFSFFLGVLLHRTKHLWAPRLPKLSAWLVYLLVLLLLATPTAPSLQTAFHLLAVLVASPLLVMLGAVARPQARTKTVSALLGALSYPLYALHLPIIFLGRYLATGWHAPSLIQVLLVSGLVAMALALPSIYEAPFRHRLTAAFGGRRANLG